MKKISENDFIVFLKAMQFFSQNPDRYYKITEITKVFDDMQTALDARSIHRKITELTEFGYLTCIPVDKRTYQYRLSENTLLSLENTILYNLTAFTDFCRNIYYPAVCGHYLMDTLSIINQQKHISYDTLFLCKHLHMGQVLEDEKLWTLLTAIHEKEIISLHYKGILHQHLQPHKIIINETDGRRYVFCIMLKNNRNSGILYRLGNILEIAIEKKKKENPLVLPFRRRSRQNLS